MNEISVSVVFTTKGTTEDRSSIHGIADDVFKTFGDRAKMTSYQSEHSDVEAIFTIQRPLLATDEVNKEFFEQLEALLIKFARFSPYFTN